MTRFDAIRALIDEVKRRGGKQPGCAFLPLKDFDSLVHDCESYLYPQPPSPDTYCVQVAGVKHYRGWSAMTETIYV